MIAFLKFFHIYVKIYNMSTKGDEQGKKITANTVALKARVRGGTKEFRQIFFFFLFTEKRN